MSKVKLFIACSLDGYIATEDGSVSWLNDLPQFEEDASYDEFYQSVGVLVMGSKTYLQIVEELSETWPYPGVKTYVLSSKISRDDDLITSVNMPVETLVRKLKEESPEDIWIVGGSHIISPLINHNLVDEYMIGIVPIILGNGIPLFQSIENPQALRLINTFRKNDIVYVHYAPKDRI